MLVHLFYSGFGIKECIAALKIGEDDPCMVLHFKTRSKLSNIGKNENSHSIFTKEINKVTQFLTSESHIATQLLSLE
jgi:hypothetical protein